MAIAGILNHQSIHFNQVYLVYFFQLCSPCYPIEFIHRPLS